MSKTEQANNHWIDKFMDKIQDRSVILKIIGIGLVIIFWDLLINVYNTLIIQPILSKYKAHWSIDLFLLCCCVIFAFVVFYKIRKKEYKILSNISLYILSAMCISYLIVRFSDTGFKYYPLFYSKSIAIADFIILIISVIIIYSISQPILSQKHIYSYNKEPETDSLFRYDYAEAIATLIKNKKGDKDSFAIGIVGKWGDGKTFLMDLTKEHLRKNNDSIIIDFNPWYSSTPKALISDFFATLKNELKKHNPNISSSFNSYARQLVKYYDKNNVLESVFETMINNPSTLKEQFTKVKVAIEKIDKQIVICIDDLDRLDKEEIIEVIRLIRNTANFSNTVFLVTYDKAYVNSAIKSLNEHGYDTYLEKIFQQEVVLPAIDSLTLKKALIRILSSRIGKDSEFWLTQLICMDFGFSKIFDDFFKNYRDIYRFANLFTLPYIQLKDNIYNEDFFFLQALNFKFPSIYELIKEDLFNTNWHNSKYFILFDSLHYNHEVICLKPLIYTTQSTKDLYYFIMEYVFEQKRWEKYDIELIKLLLHYIFPFSAKSFPNNEPRLNNDYRRIFLKSNYKTYFAYNPINISHKELTFIFEKTESEINLKIKQWVLEGNHETLDVYFNSIDKFKSKDEYEKIIQSMFYFANQMNPKRDRIVEFNNNITRKWISNKTAMSFYSDSASHKSFILQVFGQAQAPALFPSGFLARQLGDWERKNEDYGEMPFSKEEALELNNKYLKDYIKESTSFSVQVFWLYNNCNHPNIKSIEKANSLMIKLAKVDLDNFLKFIVVQPIPSDKIFNLTDHVISIFGTYEKFEEFLVEVKNNEDYYNEFMTFYNLTKYHGYSEVPFNFTHLKNQISQK